VRLMAKWPIRAKFYAATSLLALMVVVLAVSGLQGGYAYRNAANAISRRAAQMPLAQRVAKEASDLRHAFDALIHSSQEPGPLTTTSFTMLRYRFLAERSELTLAIESYREMLVAADPVDDVLGDSSEELQTIRKLEDFLQSIDSMDRSEIWMLNLVNTQTLGLELEALTDAAQELPTFYQKRMAGFRDSVRGKYRTWIAMAWGSALSATGIFVAVWWFFRRMVMHPFRQLMQGCRKIGEDFNHRIELGTSDELDELGEALNHMADRFKNAFDKLKRVNEDLDLQVQQRTREAIRSEHLASVGFLAAGVSHEINNPMAAIAWSAEALESRLHEVLYGTGSPTLCAEQIDALRENLRRIQQEAFRCKEITDQLLDFSRLGDVQPQPTELSSLVGDVVAMVSTLGQFRNKSIRIQPSNEVFASVNPQEIKQVTLNLLTNALQSLDGESGCVRVGVWRDPDFARISVEDDGCGLSEEVREHLFEPFFTRRRDGRGTGLGLSISYRIIQQNGGKIEAHSEGVNRGTRIDIYLPLSEKSEAKYDQSKAA
jgi:two-component system, NtrC family, sensor kinase